MTARISPDDVKLKRYLKALVLLSKRVQEIRKGLLLQEDSTTRTRLTKQLQM